MGTGLGGQQGSDSPAGPSEIVLAARNSVTSTTIQEGYQPGCIGRVVQLHATYYAASNGFGADFEAKVARELGAFCTSFTPGRDGLWLAVDTDIEGSIAIDGSRANDDGAHLSWFVTSEAIRGRGTGRKLIAKALEFADARQYQRTYLWTIDGLLAARHLYEWHGFHLVHESLGSRWGTVVREQKFVREALHFG